MRYPVGEWKACRQWRLRTAVVLAVLLGTGCGALVNGLRLPEDPQKMGATMTSDSQHLKSLIDSRWEHSMREFPEFATLVGDRRYNDRWTDFSSRAIERRRAENRATQAQLREIDTSLLTRAEKLNYDLLRFEIDDLVEGAHFSASQTFPGSHDYSNLYAPITPMGGVQQKVLRFIAMMPNERVADYENILARLRAVPKLVDQTIDLMKIGLERGMAPPRITLRNVAEQIGGYLVDDPMASPFLTSFQQFPEEILPHDRDRLKAEAVDAFEREVRPAFRSLHRFFTEEYLPATSDAIAMAAMPGGAENYAYRVRHFTTTDLNPAEVHKIGLAEVERIRSEMEELIESVGFEGSIEKFGQHLSRDPQLIHAAAEDLLSDYRDLAKRADLELPRLFGVFPSLPYGITAVPAEYEKTFSAAYYQPGSLLVGRAAEFVVNTYDLGSRPRWEMEALFLHEAVPGHHTQVALAQELENVPLFRRHYWPVAFGEGWAMYAETLGYQMGFYTDPASQFGQLSSEMWRAVRLTVDTGIHSQGWSREAAIEFFRRNTGKNEHDIVVEVDRYIVWPGHALAYKIGQLEIQRLREYAKRVLGEAFELRTFHDQILKNGAVPLNVLQRQIHEWVEAVRSGVSNRDGSISALPLQN